MSEDSAMHNGSMIAPVKRWITDVQGAQERRADLVCGSIFKLDALLMRDRRETGCTRYTVFRECVDRILVWRDED